MMGDGRIFLAGLLFVTTILFSVTCNDDKGTDPEQPETSVPTVTTADISEITQTTATCGGSVTSDGGAIVTARGVCWSTDSTPTLADSKTTDGTGAGSFTSAITGLSASTQYYIRAYATNAAGTGYGMAVSFTTGAPIIPTVTTSSITTITSTGAECGGTVTSDGGATISSRGVCWSTNPTPTVADSKTIDGSGPGSFTSAITGLFDNTLYYVRAYATNSAGSGYGDAISFRTLTLTSSLTDIDGNVYQTVKIGDQWWMAENLRVTHYRDGDPIPNVSDANDWQALSDGAYCNYNNNEDMVTVYGRLYNGYVVVDSREIAPDGWHVPSDAEWKQLETYLGMSYAEVDGYNWRGTDEGGKLKESGTSHWESPNLGATNESWFTALPHGYRNDFGDFYSMGSVNLLWSSSGYAGQDLFSRYLSSDRSTVGRFVFVNSYGFSVRCVKD